MQTQTSLEPGRPAAWQPCTFRGVAAYARARVGWLLLSQGLVATSLAGVVCWFLAVTWFPTVRTAIRQMPETGTIEAGRRVPPGDAPVLLAETRFLGVFLDPSTQVPVTSPADLRVEFHETNVAFCVSAGCVRQPYPADRTLPFNRTELEAAWDAWQPMLFGLAALGTLAGLWGSWLILATALFPVPWLIAYFKDRRCSVAGAWKLSGAALLPGALLMGIGLVLYGLGLASLVQLTLLWAVHLPVGLVYLACAPARLPRTDDAAPRRRNPFGRRRAEAGEDPAKSKSPFNPTTRGG